MKATRRKAHATKKMKARTAAAVDGETSVAPTENHDFPDVTVSMFDYSVENHLRAMETISKLCGEADIGETSEQSEIDRLSSTITFLREWRHFTYKPRVIRFACENGSPQGKDDVNGINLPQFSAATVPEERLFGSSASPGSRKDFVLHVGGPVWALDWCPRVHQSSDCHNCEFIAVAAHPPESSYHKIGAPLTGRGVIQIWCLLNVSVNEEEVPPPMKNPKRMPRKNEVVKDKSTQPKRPRGRPRKMPIAESLNDLGCNNQLVQALAVQFPEDSSKVPAMDGVSKDTHEYDLPKDYGRNNEVVKDKSKQSNGPRGRPRKKPMKDSMNDLGCNNQFVQALAVQFPEDSSEVPAMDGVSKDTHEYDLPKDYGRNNEVVKDRSTQQRGPRGRPRKKPMKDSLNDLGCNNQLVQSLAVQFPEDSSKVPAMDEVSKSTLEHDPKVHGRKRKGFSQGMSACTSAPKTSVQRKRLKEMAREGGGNDGICQSLLMQKEDKESFVENLQTHNSCEQDPMVINNNVSNYDSFKNSSASYPISKDVALPRLVLCLAHNGKVAWDVKWRPSCVYDSECKHRMGYLAVLLGNGSLEVWEVPFPRTVNSIYSSSHGEGTDPRFVKMEPVFRCSKLMCGDRKSIPLTVEWSASVPNDLILVGCHDGTVALWKFSASGSSKETRPLLCFSADTVPIRAVSWAPVEIDPESANVIVTAGHGGLKFWDIRDPFRPLWDVIPDRRIVYSLNWLPDPRCLILSFDDGGLKILSLAKAAYDVPVTGLPFGGTQLQGLHSYHCSSFPIWSVQVSRLTGMVAYCSADGTVLRFQLTAKAVEKDPFRNRAPHFLCGLLTEEDSALTVHTPLPNIPFPTKKPHKDLGDTPRSMRGFSIESSRAAANDQKVKGQTSEDQTLALCHGDDPGVEFGSENTLATPKSKQIPKSKTKSKKNSNHDQALVCRDEETEKTGRKENGKGEVGNEIEVFPPKVVAMHRVRWNMNKGSERWLCYGGAAGIVRCQEIVLSDVDKKLLAKR
ncbi:hypothetical protein L1049_008868 [Liquidambar formosana]|uniref:Uncharacterized protein n=1 Tax=Liquidambar formosana TaxID=63359 RepID=A0AAP0X2K5_LIQFO